MNSYPWRIAGLLCLLLPLAACGSSDQQRAAWQLDQRLQARLAPDIAAGNATVQPLPDGAQVTLLSHAQSPSVVQPADGSVGDARAHLIQGLLDPRLLRVQVTDTSGLSPDQQTARVQELTRYFVDYRLGPTLALSALPQGMPSGPGGAVPPGLTVTISVQCPPDHERTVNDTDMAPIADTDIQPPSCQ